MQSLQDAIDQMRPAERCAGQLLACVPSIMRYIRQQMRSHRNVRLSVPQFRALIFATVQEGASLSAMAEHLGLSLPATSRMADLLVKRGLLERNQGIQDRRRISLSPTRKGTATYKSAQRATREAIARKFDAISKEERVQIGQAMAVLGRLFGTIGAQADESSTIPH